MNLAISLGYDGRQLLTRMLTRASARVVAAGLQQGDRQHHQVVRLVKEETPKTKKTAFHLGWQTLKTHRSRELS